MQYSDLLGPVLGFIVETHQHYCESQVRTTYNKAVKMASESDKVLEGYDTPTNLILKLVVDGKCLRQARVKNGSSGSIDQNSVAAAMKSFGFQKCSSQDATGAIVQYIRAMQAADVDGPTIILKSETGQSCNFKILGGMWKVGKSNIRMWCEDFDKTLPLESDEVRALVSAYTLQDTKIVM